MAEMNVRKYKIQAKSSEYILCPANAIEDDFYKRKDQSPFLLQTVDGAEHEVVFLCTWFNHGSVYDDELEAACQRYYGMTFEAIRSMWIGRLGRVDDYWHLIKLD